MNHVWEEVFMKCSARDYQFGLFGVLGKMVWQPQVRDTVRLLWFLNASETSDVIHNWLNAGVTQAEGERQNNLKDEVWQFVPGLQAQG